MIVVDPRPAAAFARARASSASAWYLSDSVPEYLRWGCVTEYERCAPTAP